MSNFKNGIQYDANDFNAEFDLVAYLNTLASHSPGKGSALVADDSGATVHDLLPIHLQFATYADLRNYSHIQGVDIVQITGDGIAGIFKADPSDTTTADNGGTVIVAADAMRWKRQYNGVENVLWFGATGDGSTDDAAAFRAADAASGSGVLYAPRGTYLLNSQVVLAQTGLIGDGYQTIILNGTSDSAGLLFGSQTNRIYSRRVENFTISQATSVTAASGNIGVKFDNCGQFHVANVIAHDNLDVGLSFNNCTQFLLRNVRAQNSLSTNIEFDGNCLDLYWFGGRADACVNGDGIKIQNSQGFYVFGVTAYGNSNRAWHLANGGTYVNHNMWFIGCIGDTSGVYNWVIESLQRGFFTACWASTQKSTTANTYAAGFYIVGGTGTALVQRLTFSGGEVTNNNAHGMYIDHCDGVVIQGLDATGNGVGASADGIHIASTAAQNVQIVGGDARGNSGTGVSGANSTTRITDLTGYTTQNWGTVNITPDANGQGTIAHGLAATPGWATVNMTGSTSSEAEVLSIGSTNITVRIRNSTSNANITSGTYGITWNARV